MVTRVLAVIGCFAAACSVPAAAKESITLTSGFRLEAESHTSDGDSVSFRVGTGEVTFSKAQIANIEILPETSLSRAAEGKRSVLPVDQILSTAAFEAGLEPEFVKSVAKAESAFQQSAVSKKGATGLMQLMPATAKE